VFLTASDPLYWRRWTHVSESVEMRLDRTRLNELSRAFGGPLNVEFEYRELVDDPAIVGIAARFRSAMFAHEPRDPMRIEALAGSWPSIFLKRIMVSKASALVGSANSSRPSCAA
jgi:hypothetical protein